VCALDAVIENAVKATAPGDTIIVRARAEEDSALLEVIDVGPGIPAEALPRIFDRFARQPHRNGGTGLGLPIVKAIAEAHGGSVSVTSRPGAGTSVALRLPGYSEGSAPHAAAAGAAAAPVLARPRRWRRARPATWARAPVGGPPQRGA
jgi:signal transduction histidine kinase